ncbi:bifunctional nuclease domain-containing protein [Arhodomonas sp. AD133]|uniref:bifunctional nuclease family protein n=1 Tax=Arhodomonas sp. AD133 TaxID=3415009 RepID=UPI003EBF79E2
MGTRWLWPLAGLLILGAAVMAPLSQSPARELAADEEDMHAVELATVGVETRSGSPVVLLREPDSGDIVPIFIGPAEARSILMALHGVPTPRPMTHDLILDLLEASSAELIRVYVDDIVNSVYLGMLVLRLPDREEPVMVDTRPSDALALAARTGASIQVAGEVLEAGRDLTFRGLENHQAVTALGITVVRATEELREAMDLPDSDGVLVSRTTGAAAEAGMEPGSLITGVNGETPATPMDFLRLVRETTEGEQAQLAYWQDDEEHALALSTDVPTASGDEPRGRSL